VLSILTRTLRLVAARWPVLLAWFLAGWLVRYVIIEIAAFFGATSALVGLLILPLAILARLGSYIAMFLVLRGDMPSFQSISDKGDDAIDRTTSGGRRQRVTDIFLISILPFFAFYAAWKLLAGDVAQYAETALGNIDFFAPDSAAGADSRVLEVPLDVWSIGVIVVAFTGRFLLKRYAANLPRWTNLAAVYLESVWVFLTLFIITTYTATIQEWVSSRAAVHWYESAKAAVFAAVAPIGWVWSGVEWAVNETGALILLPLAWLTLAGIVYGRALTKPRMTFAPANRYYAGVRQRVSALPSGVLRRAKDVGTDLTDRWRPLAGAFLLIWRAGVVPMGLFVLAYTVLEAAGTWLLLAGVRIIGPHDLHTWWMNFDDMLVFVVNLIIEPLRLCLIAAAYDFCLRKLEERREAATDAGERPEESAVVPAE
jgi:hypothetical protein